MKKFKVWVKEVAYHYAFIEAEDEGAALDIALNMDGSEFIHSNQIDWDVYSVDEVTND